MVGTSGKMKRKSLEEDMVDETRVWTDNERENKSIDGIEYFINSQAGLLSFVLR